MSNLTAEETRILRDTLGLSYWNREKPTKNRVYEMDKNSKTLSKMVDRGYLETYQVHGMGGLETYHKATEAGEAAVLQAQWPE